MTIKTAFSPCDLAGIFDRYDLGTYIQSESAKQGTVQTNLFVQTTQGKYVFRYYENRSKESVLFESHLLEYLTMHCYPCPTPIKNREGAYVGMYHHKPYMIFKFLEGRHLDCPSPYQQQQLIRQIALLQKLTENYHSPYMLYRWNYDVDLCLALAEEEATKANTKNTDQKLVWLAHQLTRLDLPSLLPKSICHCDLHFSNILFQADEFAALIDFDDANYTFPQFDLVGVMEYWAWPHQTEQLNMTQARNIVQEYMKYRPLTIVEREHLYDVYKLSILIDCVWFFSRGTVDDFYEKRKIDFLTDLGRQQFFAQIFSN